MKEERGALTLNMVAASLDLSSGMEDSLKLGSIMRVKGSGARGWEAGVNSDEGVFSLQCPRPPAEGSTIISQSTPIRLHGLDT